MGYKISATIKNSNSERTPDQVDLVSFGIRLGDEVLDYKFDGGTLDRIRNSYNGMMKKTPKSMKPITLSWFPLSEKKTLFSFYVNKTADIRLTVINQENKFSWEFAFESVVLSRPKPDFKLFPNFKRQDERYDGTFVKFVDDRG